MNPVIKLLDKFSQRAISESHADERGFLTVVNFRDLPFEPKRLFWISNVPHGSTRGNHGHYYGKQFLLCQAGEVQITVWPPRVDEAIKCTLFKGDDFFLPAEHWIEMKFIGEGTILMVFANSEYDEQDLFKEPIK